jgi:hypothetical protein
LQCKIAHRRNPAVDDSLGYASVIDGVLTSGLDIPKSSR